MNASLNKLLSTGHSESDGIWTHFTDNPHRKWNIKTNFLNKFWENYIALVQNNVQNLCLYEKVDLRAPFILDSKFEFYESEIDFNKIFDDVFLLKYIYCFQSVLFDFLEIGNSTLQLITVILEDKPLHANGRVVINLRLHFPYCKTDVSFQKKRIVPEIIKRLHIENVVSSLPIQPIGNWNDMINVDTLNEGIVMYGSRDSKANSMFYLNKITNVIQKEHFEDETIVDMEISEAFSLFSHTDILNNIINPNLFKDLDDADLLPLFLSLNYCSNIIVPKDTSHNNFKFKINTGVYDSENPDLELAENVFLPLLDSSRVENDNYWLDIGQCLYRCSDGSKRGLDLWQKYTSQSLKRNIRECIKYYHTFSSTRLTIKTLAWYARTDNYSDYSQWHAKWAGASISNAMECTHEDVAIAIYKTFWLEVVYDRDYFIYEEKKHKWVRDIGSAKFHKLIRNEFTYKYEALRVKKTREVQECKNPDTKSLLEIQIKKIGKLIEKLKNHPFKTTVMKSAQSEFSTPGFSLKLDESPYYLGMDNCIIDTSGKGKPFVREGKPEDFVSMSTNVKYPFEYDEPYDSNNDVATYFNDLKDQISDDTYNTNRIITESDSKTNDLYDNVSTDLDKLPLAGWRSPLTRKLMKWFGQVFVDPELRHFFIKDCSSFLRGRNSEKLLRIWSGKRNGSKSMVAKLFRAFGSYKIDLPIEFLGGAKKSGSGPTPEMARSKGTRAGLMTEPDETEDKLTSGKVKRFVSGDSFYARFLNDNGGDIEMMNKLILMCNEIPEIVGLANDEASMSRLLIIPYLSQWLSDAPDDIVEQYKTRKFKINPFFEDIIPTLYSSFIWVLVQYFPYYLKEGLNPPEIVSKYTRDHINKCDQYIKFRDEVIEKAYTDESKIEIDKTACITVSELYTCYKDWFKASFPGVKLPTGDIVKREMEKRIGKLDGKVWTGMRIVRTL
jgi:hypothetical protein